VKFVPETYKGFFTCKILFIFEGD